MIMTRSHNRCDGFYPPSLEEGNKITHKKPTGFHGKPSSPTIMASHNATNFPDLDPVIMQPIFPEYKPVIMQPISPE